MSSRRATPLFTAVIITFFFTFANVSCQGQHVASLSGFQLAFGTQISQTDMWGNPKNEKVRAEPLAFLALLAAAGGAGLALIGSATRRLTTMAGVAGAFFLLFLTNKMSRDAIAQSSGLLNVSAGFGLVLAVLFFLSAAAVAWLGGREPRTTISYRAPDKVPNVL